MAKTSKVKAAAPEFPVPQSIDEVNHAIDTIGAHQRELQKLEAEMNEKISGIKAEYGLRAEPFVAEIKALAAGVQVYCDAHRGELTQGMKVKFARLAAGEVTWRLGNPAVRIKKGISEETILQLLRGLKRTEYIRTREELDKEAILGASEVRSALDELVFSPGKPKVVQVAGLAELTVQQAESFAIKPHASELETTV